MTDDASTTTDTAETAADGGNPPQQNVQLLRDPNAAVERYADGLLGVMIRESVFKLEFHRVIAQNPETGEETWQVADRLVLPITAAPQLLNAMQQVMQALQQAGRLRVQPPEGTTDKQP